MRKRILSLVLATVMLMSMSTGMTLRDDAEGAEMTPSAEPEVFAEPEASEVPEATEEPGSSAETETTEPTAPAGDLEAPEEPGPTEEPEVTEDQEVTEDREATEEPELTVEPEPTEEPGEDEGTDAAEEPAGEVMVLALDAPAETYFSDSSNVGYYGNGSLAGTNVKNVLMVSSGNSSVKEDVFKTYAESITGTLTGPGIDGEKSLGKTTGTVTFSTNRNIYWDNVVFTQEGEYTLELSSGGEKIATIKFTIVKVVFHAGDNGSFPGQAKQWAGYGMKNNYLSQFNIPDLTISGGSDPFYGLVGWAKEQGGPAYSIIRVEELNGSGNVYDAYAVYNVRQVTEYEITDKDVIVDRSNLTLDEASYGYTEGTSQKVLTIKNTGNKPIELSVGGVSSGLSVVLSKSTLSTTGDTCTLTITPKENLGLGTHKMSFILFSGLGPSPFTVTFTVSIKAVTVTANGNITKTYGEVLRAEDERVKGHFTVSDGMSIDELNLSIDSTGFSSRANVNKEGYPVTVKSGNPNYQVKVEGSCNVMVEKADPAGTVGASGIKVGKKLSDSKLEGTFSNPFQPEMSVTGTLTWDDAVNGAAESIIPDEGTQTYHWKFIPDAESANNYNERTGTATVMVSAKDPTEIILQAGQNLNDITYDGKTHEAKFETKQPGAGAITVEYSTDNVSWSTTLPKAVGHYFVKATAAETEEYAAGEMKWDMTIVPKALTANIYRATKTYDGTTDAEIRVVTIGVVSGEDARVEAVDVRFQDPNVGTNKTITYTLVITGKDSGNYKLLNRAQGSYVGNIDPAFVTVSGTATKEYGETLTLTADMFKFTTTGTNRVVEVSNAQFTSSGTAYDKPVGSYDVNVSLVGGGNYALVPGAGTITGGLVVNKATPRLLEGKVHVSSGKEGEPLSTVTITGTYENPHNSALTADGTFSWVDPEEKLPQVEEHSTYDAAWKFTLSEEAARNYNPPAPADKATITVLDKPPIALQAEPMTVEYDGDAHPFTAQVIQNDVDADKIELQYEYKEHREPGQDASGSWADWTGQPPVDAGLYDVQVTAKAGTNIEYEDGVVESTLTITQTAPKTDGLKKELTVLQGTALDEALANQLGQPKGVKDGDVEGVYAWDVSGTVEKDGEIYDWTFTPTGAHERNYRAVSGSVKILLADDPRVLKGDIYNLPDSGGYQDYAVLDIGADDACILKVGETVAIYNSDHGMVAGSATVTADDVASGKLTIPLSADMVGNDAVTLNAYITSSIKHQGNEINSPAELDVTVQENVSLYIDEVKDLTATLAAGYKEDDIQSVSFAVENGSEAIQLTHEGRSLTATMKGLAAEHVHIGVTVTIKHPDPAKAAAGESITITKRVHVDVSIKPGEVTTGVTQDGTPAVSADPDTLKEGVLNAGDQELIAQGLDIHLELIVADADESVPPEDKTAVDACIDKNCPGYVVGQYLDVSILKTVEGRTPTEVHETTCPIRLVISVPNDLRVKGRTFCIIRVHDDVATVLKDQDSEPNTITIETDLFSTYAIAYTDEAPSTSPGSGSGSGSNSAPATGDDSAAGLWLGLMVLGLCGLAATAVWVSRSRKRSR